MTTQKLSPPKIPECGFIRLKQVLEVIPVSKSSWWDGIRRGIYPAGLHVSQRITAWRCSDIQALIDRINTGNQPLQNEGVQNADTANACTEDHV